MSAPCPGCRQVFPGADGGLCAGCRPFSIPVQTVLDEFLLDLKNGAMTAALLVADPLLLVQPMFHEQWPRRESMPLRPHLLLTASEYAAWQRVERGLPPYADPPADGPGPEQAPEATGPPVPDLAQPSGLGLGDPRRNPRPVGGVNSRRQAKREGSRFGTYDARRLLDHHETHRAEEWSNDHVAERWRKVWRRAHRRAYLRGAMAKQGNVE